MPRWFQPHSQTLAGQVEDSLAGPARNARGDLTRRLSRAEGQLRGIQRMIREGRDCEEVVNQLLAVRAALDRVIDLELASGLKDCMKSLPPGVAEKEVSRLVGMVARVGSGARQITLAYEPRRIAVRLTPEGQT